MLWQLLQESGLEVQNLEVKIRNRETGASLRERMRAYCWERRQAPGLLLPALPSFKASGKTKPSSRHKGA